jgi:2-dehydropantoate 2-reductase
MRFAVLGGAGAMGGIFGAKLSAAGHDVTLIDVNEAAVSAINAKGLLLEAKDGTRTTYTVRASAKPAEVGEVDVIMNFVKCYHTDAAVTAAKPMLGKNTAVLTLQNGWGNAPKIASIVGDGSVLVGLTYHSGTLLGLGEVKHPGMGMTFIGEPQGGVSPRVSAVAEALRAGGFEVTESPNIMNEVWKKLCLNICTLPTSGLLRFFAHELVAYEDAKSEMAALLKEAVSVGKAKGITIDYDERWQAITSLLEKAIGGKASMLQDVEAGRRTEIDVINGAIVAAGRETGVATPHNQAMVFLVKALEAKYLSQARA